MNFLKLFDKPSLIAAHRGARLLAPENTLKAMRMSMGKCDFIEVDVQLSKDSIPIIIHDDTLTRTTNVRSLEEFQGREPYFVHDFTLKELRRLDYGEGESLLTLRGALRFIKENGLYLNVEIKDVKESFKDMEVVERVLKEIIALEVQESVLISSFRHEYLSLCKQILPSVPTAALVEEQHPENLLTYLSGLRVDCYHMSEELVDSEIVSELKKTGYYLGVYTVNDFVRRRELFEMGFNVIFSDV